MSSPSSNPHDDTQQQINELLELRNAHRRRLRVLQIQAAQQGADTPPHIKIETADLDTKITEINATISALQQSMRHAESETMIPEPKSLVPVSVVPETINERLIAFMMTLENYQQETRRGFTAMQIAMQRDTERLHDQITREHEERRASEELTRDENHAWRKQERAQRLDRQQNQSRWMFLIGLGLFLVIVVVIILAFVVYVNIIFLPVKGG